MDFFLGTHHPNWLELTDLPLFVSHRWLHKRRRLPSPQGRWALDSGGFTELSLHGRWTISEVEYVAAVERFREEMPGLAWAAPQDWMCEPAMRVRTGLTVQNHQDRTIRNYLALRMLAPDLPFIPVLQGWEASDYERHVEAYARAGVSLEAEPLVGVGSVCRRQATSEIEGILHRLHRGGLRLHGFGIKLTGLRRYADTLASADSMAWSIDARWAASHGVTTPGCTHKSCSNCLRYATRWRHRAVRRLDEMQLRLELG